MLALKKIWWEAELCGNYRSVSLPTASYYVLKGHAQ